jgi:tetratricopeptide (TPR) repeat protein
VVRRVIAVTFAAMVAFVAPPVFSQEDPRLLEGAREQLEAAVRRNPADFKARTLLGKAYSLAGAFDKALEQFKQAATLGDLNALLFTAEALTERGDLVAARDAFETARLAARRAQDPGRQAEAELGLAHVEFLRGAYEKALSSLDAVQNGDKQAAMRLRGRLFAMRNAVRAGQVLQEGMVAMWTEGAKAREALSNALALDENDARTLYALGRFYLEAPAGFGDLERAEVLLGRAVKVRPGNVIYRAWWIRTLAQRGKDAETSREIATFEQAFSAYPASKAIVERLKEGRAP